MTRPRRNFLFGSADTEPDDDDAASAAHLDDATNDDADDASIDDVERDGGDNADVDDADEDDADEDDELRARLDEEFDLGDGVADMVAEVSCPYCGEVSDLSLDPGGGAEQSYVEDCQVCCQPWLVHVSYQPDGSAYVSADAADGS